MVKHDDKLQCGNNSGAQRRQVRSIHKDLTGYFSAAVTSVNDKREGGCWPPLDGKPWRMGTDSQSLLQELSAETKERRAELWSLELHFLL